MRPSNRKLRKPELPPDILEEKPPAPEPALEPEPVPAAPKLAGPPSRAMTILRNVAGFALVAAISLTVAFGARRYLMTSPRFALQQFIVDGQKTRSKDALMARAGVSIGQNVFSIDLDRARAKILGDPYVASATLARRLPDTILLQIEERTPVAVVSLGDAFLVTRDGEVFKRLEVGDPSDLPIITGLSPEQAETDREGFSAQVRSALDVAADYQQSSLGGKMALQEIHLEPGVGLSLVVGQSATSIVLGGPPFRRKLEEASRVVAELERRGQKPDAVLLGNDARPERVVARVR
jgi:cell division protein FtsQ